MSHSFENLPENLTCPRCGSNLTHQEAVEVYSRKEDGTPRVTLIDLYTGETSEIQASNPSLRRQGVKILTRCEDGCRFSFNIYQHKGFTCLDYD